MEKTTVRAWPVGALLAEAQVGKTHLPPEIMAAYNAGMLEFEAEHVNLVVADGILPVGVDHWLIAEGNTLVPMRGDVFLATHRAAQ